MKVQGIYAITHTASGRVYVGSAVDIPMRWHIHRHHLRQNTHHAARLQAAWSSDGVDAFSFGILERVSNKKNLLTREQWWIDELNAMFLTTGFNSCPVAGSPMGTKHSDAAKAKMRAAKLGKPAPWNSRPHTEEQNERHSALMTGRKRGPHSPEHCARISAAHIGKSASPETRAKLSAAWYQRRELGFSDATRAKLSAAQMGNKNAVGNKNRLGQPVSQETKGRMRIKAIGNHNALGFKHSDEVKARMAAGQKARQARERAARLPLLDQVAALPDPLRHGPA